MTTIRFAIPLFHLLLLFFVFQPVYSYSMDPRFELNPSQVHVGPHQQSQHERAARKKRSASRRHVVSLKKEGAGQGDSATSLQLVSPQPTATKPDLQQIRSFWEKLISAGGDTMQPLVFHSDSFDLSIDPARYPLLKTADGKKLLLDTDGTLPPLVRTLIQDKDSSLRVVTASPANTRQFLGALLGAGGFYSVEEQPVMSFGNDPQLKVRVDFKVERSAESVMKNEVTLISASSLGMPPRLVEYLQKEGFELLEPFAGRVATPVPLRHRIIYVSPQTQGQSVDLLLEALSVPVERNRRVELFSAVESGIALSVAVDRSFERAGRRYVVARFNGDPVAYTLFRLLETKGYRVVILEPQDTFKVIAGKLLSRMNLPSGYASHLLIAEPSGRYSMEMSGFLLENTSSGGGALMLTDRPLERTMRELLYDYGYQVQKR